MSEYFGGDKEPVRQLYYRAVDTMCRLNRDGLNVDFVFFILIITSAARLMRKYNAHAATDVTGFGILGHARNLAEHQKNYVELQVH